MQEADVWSQISWHQILPWNVTFSKMEVALLYFHQEWNDMSFSATKKFTNKHYIKLGSWFFQILTKVTFTCPIWLVLQLPFWKCFGVNPEKFMSYLLVKRSVQPYSSPHWGWLFSELRNFWTSTFWQIGCLWIRPYILLGRP